MAIRHLSRGSDEDRKGLGQYLHSWCQTHDGKMFQLVLLSCAQFWQALLVGCSVPPTTRIKTQNKIRIYFYDKLINSPTTSTTRSLSWLCTYTLHQQPLPSLEDHVLPESKDRDLVWKPDMNKQNDMTNYLNGIVLVPLVKLNEVQQTFIEHLCTMHMSYKENQGVEDE